MHQDRWNDRYRARERLWPEAPSPALVELAADLPPGRALDLAAGEGRNAFHLARQGWEVHATDFSEVAVERGRALARELGVTVHWAVQDVTETAPPAATFDLVGIFYLHLPWEQLARVLGDAAGALRPGGHLLVVGHDTRNLTEGTGGPQDPAVLYGPQDVAGVLGGDGPAAGAAAGAAGDARGGAGGLEILRAGRQRRPVDHGEADRDAIQVDCVVLARRLTGR
jgi:SAM-dependent methyltransferase